MWTWGSRILNVILISMLLAGGLWAINEAAPFVVTKGTGNYPVHILDDSGIIHNSGAQQMTPTARWSVRNSAGTTIAAFTPAGTIVASSTDNVSATALVDGTGETNEVTATFAVAEADTNYRVISTVEDTVDTTTRAYVRRRNTTSVVFASDCANATGYVVWTKIRTN